MPIAKRTTPARKKEEQEGNQRGSDTYQGEYPQWNRREARNQTHVELDKLIERELGLTGRAHVTVEQDLRRIGGVATTQSRDEAAHIIRSQDGVQDLPVVAPPPAP